MFDHNLYFMACKRVLRANVESGKEEMMVFKKSLKNYNGEQIVKFLLVRVSP